MAPPYSINPVRPDELVTITFAMPAAVAVELAPRWADELGRLMAIRRPPSDGEFDIATFDSSTITAPFSSNHRADENAWQLPPITASDLPLVCWAVDNWSDNGRRLAAALLVNAAGIHTLDLADSVGYTGAIPAAFRAIAGRLRAINRAPFWEGDQTTKGHPRGQRVWCDTNGEAYRVVREVFEARYPELLPVSALAADGGPR